MPVLERSHCYTLAFSPSGPEALWPFSLSNSLATSFGSTVMSPIEENRLAPFKGGSESSSRVKADWNCPLQILAFSLESVLRIQMSRSEVVPNTSFLSDLISDKNFLILRVSESELSFSNVNILEMCFQ